MTNRQSMKTKQIFSARLLYRGMGLGLLMFFATHAMAQDTVNPINVGMERFHAATYQQGTSFPVQVRISSGNWQEIQALGLRETIPNGWVFEGMTGVTGDLPAVTPAQGATGLLEFAWITIPEMPYTFSYTLRVPEEDGGGGQVIHGSLEYRLSGPAQFAAPVITTINGGDSQPPAIRLNGGASITLQQGDNWSEPGYTASDNVDGDLTAQVQVSGSVNPNVASSYVLTYTVSDKAGNQGRATRTVRVVSSATSGGGVPTPTRPVGGGIGTGGGTGVSPDTGNATGGGLLPGAMPENNPQQKSTPPSAPAASPAKAAPQGSLNMRPGVYAGQTPGSGIVIPESGDSSVSPTPLPITVTGASVNDTVAPQESGGASLRERVRGSAEAVEAETKLSDEWPELAQAAPAGVAAPGAAPLDAAPTAPGPFGPQGVSGNLLVAGAVAAVCLLGLLGSTLAARSVYGGRRRRAVPPK
ncbi:MAG: hypothetical protein RLZZ303_3289 [Candidatus Hydrogenedentota bacterium]